MNNYDLQQQGGKKEKTNLLIAIKKLISLMKDEKNNIVFATFAGFINSGLNLTAPVIMGHVVDTYIQSKDFQGVLMYSGILFLMYVVALIANYFQALRMGHVGQNVLFNLRNAVFNKIQALPIAFFNQNKAGDLISRINNDTDKLNQFFSQGLIQFITNIVTIIGAVIFLLSINWRVGGAALIPLLVLLVFTQVISPWIKHKNATNLKSIGGMSAEIAESLDNFKVVIAFNRRDYFRKKFNEVNENNYKAAIAAGIANNTLTPVYGLATNAAQLIVVAYGIYLIASGDFTLGLLISFLSYVSRLYDPLRHMAAIWTNFQMALAGWDRIHSILLLESDLIMIPNKGKRSSASVLEFEDVSFSYPDGKEVLHNISLSLQRGKTYALVGPTGGGKTTTASLMARLYDPTKGKIFLNGKDLRSYKPEERTQKISFILQEPFLFSGTIRDNILYGNEHYRSYNDKQLEKVIHDNGLENLLGRFDQGLKTDISSSANALSLGQKQLIAFIRAVLRHPEILILDEATANIDTVTEQLLEDILKKLPKETTLIIIAHRLNTIENADEIFFINSGDIIPAGSMKHAVDMLLHGKRQS